MNNSMLSLQSDYSREDVHDIFHRIRFFSTGGYVSRTARHRRKYSGILNGLARAPSFNDRFKEGNQHDRRAAPCQ